MGNKLNEEYLLKLYETYEEDNMIYVLTILRSLGLNRWFKENCYNSFYRSEEIDILMGNHKFIDMYNLDEFNSIYIKVLIISLDNGISYFNQKQLNTLEKEKIEDIIHCKPELEKYLRNCTNYEKQIR